MINDGSLSSKKNNSMFNQYHTRNGEGILKLKSTQVKKNTLLGMGGANDNLIGRATVSSLDSYHNTNSSNGEDFVITSARAAPYLNAGQLLR